MALHQSHLPVQELIQVIAFMLNPSGNAFLLISIYEEEHYLKAASEAGLSCYRYFSVYDHPDKKIRYILCLSAEKKEAPEQSFVIREKGGDYTPVFKEALKRFLSEPITASAVL